MTDTQAGLQRMLRLAIAITDGPDPDRALADAPCPHCGQPERFYSFSVKPAPSAGYGLFIACQACKRYTHYSLSDQPRNFTPARVLPAMQAREDRAVQQAHAAR